MQRKSEEKAEHSSLCGKTWSGWGKQLPCALNWSVGTTGKCI